MDPSQSEILDYAEAQHVTGLCLGTLYALVSQRRIPHVRLSNRLVRFRRKDLEAWLDAHSVAESATTNMSELSVLT